MPISPTAMHSGRVTILRSSDNISGNVRPAGKIGVYSKGYTHLQVLADWLSNSELETKKTSEHFWTMPLANIWWRWKWKSTTTATKQSSMHHISVSKSGINCALETDVEGQYKASANGWCRSRDWAAKFETGWEHGCCNAFHKRTQVLCKLSAQLLG